MKYFLVLLLLLPGCASKKVMRDCEHVDGNYWTCEEAE